MAGHAGDSGIPGSASEARQAGQEILADLSEPFLARPDVTQGTMFHSIGLAVRGTFFAFVGADGRLVLKLPRGEVASLLESGAGTPLTMGTRTMREWVALPLARDRAGRDSWEQALQRSYAFVDANTPVASAAAQSARIPSTRGRVTTRRSS